MQGMRDRADVLQVRLGFRLHRFRHGVQDIRRFVHPAALHPGLAVNLLQGGPESHCAIIHSQFRRELQPPVFEVQEQFPPALGAFAEAVDEAENILVAPFVRCRQWFARKP